MANTVIAVRIVNSLCAAAMASCRPIRLRANYVTMASITAAMTHVHQTVWHWPPIAVMEIWIRPLKNVIWQAGILGGTVDVRPTVFLAGAAATAW
jgi:hypothetical protein